MYKICVGIILKPQGIKGEVKAYSASFALDKIKYLYLDNVRTAVVSSRTEGDFSYIKFSTINDRNHAEALRGKELFADRREIVTGGDSFLVDDLIGAEVVFENGEVLGVLQGVINNKKSADVFVVKTAAGEALFPFLKSLVLSIDPVVKKIIVNVERYKETALTDDAEEIK